MKQPFIISQIKWLRYPENKPLIGNMWYLTTLWNYDRTNVFVMHLFWHGTWNTDVDSDIYDDRVVAYSTQPKAFNINDSDVFEFCTALELMKEGIPCKKYETDMPKRLVKKFGTWYLEHLHNGEWKQSDLRLADSLGKWMLA